MKKCLFVFFTLCVLTALPSCRKYTSPTPQPVDVVERSRFTDMLADQFLIESKVTIAPIHLNKKTIATQLYQEWLTKYNITPAQFERNVEYYFQSQEQAEEIMREVIQKIEAQKEAKQ